MSLPIPSYELAKGVIDWKHKGGKQLPGMSLARKLPNTVSSCMPLSLGCWKTPTEPRRMM